MLVMLMMMMRRLRMRMELATTKKEEEEEETTTTTKKEDETTTTTTVEATILKSDKKNRIVLSDKESIYTLSEKDVGRYVTISIRELKDMEEKIPCTMKWIWEVQGGDDWTSVDENISETLERVFREGSARAVGLFTSLEKKITLTLQHILQIRYEYASRTYTADVRRRVQTNVETGTERSLRRMLVIVNEKGEQVKTAKRKVSRIGVDITVSSSPDSRKDSRLKVLDFATQVLSDSSLSHFFPRCVNRHCLSCCTIEDTKDKIKSRQILCECV